MSRIIYHLVEFLSFSSINFFIYYHLSNKIYEKINRIKILKQEKQKILEKLKMKLVYKQNLLIEKKKDLLYQEQVLNNKKKELEKYYSDVERELKYQLEDQLKSHIQNIEKSIDIAWQQKINELVYKAVVEER